MIPRALIFAAAAAFAASLGSAQTPAPKPSPSAATPRVVPAAKGTPAAPSAPAPKTTPAAKPSPGAPAAATPAPAPGSAVATPATPKPIPTYQAPPVPPHPKITMAEFLKVHGSGKHVLIDVRSLEAYREGHIPGSISLPLMYLEERAETALRKTKAPVVAYCACPAEETSARAANLLEEKGYKAAALVGGLNTWVLEGQPLMSGDVVGTWTPPAARKAAPAKRIVPKSRKPAPAGKRNAPAAGKPYTSTPVKPAPSPSPRSSSPPANR